MSEHNKLHNPDNESEAAKVWRDMMLYGSGHYTFDVDGGLIHIPAEKVRKEPSDD